MVKRLIYLAAPAALAFALAQPAVATAPTTTGHMVTICHRTGSVAGGNLHNGYSIITVDIASAGYPDGLEDPGHVQHTQIGNGPGPDLIPPYEYLPTDGELFTFPGLNLDYVFDNGQTGAEVLEAGCLFAEPSPSPTETSPPPTSTSSSPPPTSPPTVSPKTHTPDQGPNPSPTAKTGPGRNVVAGSIAGLVLLVVGAAALRYGTRKV